MDKSEMVWRECDHTYFGDQAWLFEDEEEARSYHSHYGHTGIELSKEQLMRIINGEILVASIMQEYSVSIKIKP